MWFINLIDETGGQFTMTGNMNDPTFLAFADKFFPHIRQIDTAWNAARDALESLRHDGIVQSEIIPRSRGGKTTLWKRNSSRFA
jgi:hypothetical protein